MTHELEKELQNKLKADVKELALVALEGNNQRTKSHEEYLKDLSEEKVKILKAFDNLDKDTLERLVDLYRRR